MQFAITLKAGVPLRQEFQGSTLILMDTGAAAAIDMSLEVVGFSVEQFRNVKRGLKLHGNNAQFTGATFTAAVACTIQVVVSNANIDINYVDGSIVTANIAGTVPISSAAPLNVINDRGTVGAPVYVSGITYSDAPAVTLTNKAPVACSSVAAALVAANAARRGLRLTNIGTDPVAIGFTGITWANHCIILNSGDSWIEERAANLAWAAICDAAKTASVTVQEVIA